MLTRRLTRTRAKALRANTTLPEGLLWRELRGRALSGLRFRRQHPFGPFILDFYCVSERLAVEVDGAHHGMVDPTYDRRRDAWLARYGVRVLRFAATDVLKNMEGVLTAIDAAAHAAAPSVRFADI